MRLLRFLLIPAAAALLGCAAADVSPSASAYGGSALPAPGETVLLRVHELERGEPLFQDPAAAAWYADGTLIVADPLAGRVLALDPSADRWYDFDRPDATFEPVDVALEGFKVLVLDRDDRQLLRYTLGGVFQDRLVNFVHADPSMERVPVAFDVDRSGRSLFCDSVDDQLLVLDTAYGLEAVIGSHGGHVGQFREPAGAAWLPDGRFVIADRGNARLQRFTNLGYPDGGTESVPEADGVLAAPGGLDADAGGNVYVADPVLGLVHVFDDSLRPLFSFGDDPEPGRALVSPVDVALGPDDLLAVCDAGRRAVLVYRIRRR